MQVPQFQYSAQATRVLDWAATEAKRLNHAEVQPEHLLLGMLEEPRALARFVMRALEIDLDTLQTDVRQLVSDYPSSESSTPLLSNSSREVIELGRQTANVLDRQYLGTEHILIGLLRHLSNRAYPILRRAGVNYNQVLSRVRVLPQENIASTRIQRSTAPPPIEPGETLTPFKLFTMISPVFWSLLSATIFFAMTAYNSWFNPEVAIFLFVTGGWILSVSLHEFGHAIVAFYGGDRSVVSKGYLTLNPLRYTHGFLSIVLPLIYLAIGGIGLPGGAVYINNAAIPEKRTRSMVAAAGPFMTGLFAIFLSIPFIFGIGVLEMQAHLEFWSGLAFLAFLQITALIFNLLPIPGLDGFGILRPYLPPRVAAQIGSFGALTFILIFYLFFTDSPVRTGFWFLINSLLSTFNVDMNLIRLGFNFYRFWDL